MSRTRFRYHSHGASSRGHLLVGRSDVHLIVAESEGGRPSVLPSFAHRSRSPIKNCNARSRRRGAERVHHVQSPPGTAGRTRRNRKSTFCGVVLASPRKAFSSLRNRSFGSAGRSPGNIAASVFPSKVSPVATSPATGMPRIEGRWSRPRCIVASRVARTAASATTSTCAPASSAFAAAPSVNRLRSLRGGHDSRDEDGPLWWQPK